MVLIFFMNFLKQIFTWWNRQTIGTMILIFFSGKLKGIDEFGNKYYESKSGRRWIVYKDIVEASNIPPNWYSWIHFTSNKLPNSNKKKYFWEKKARTQFNRNKQCLQTKKNN